VTHMWRLLDLGAIDGYTMTNLYEAIGHSVSSGEVPNTVVLNHPKKPFVNIGFHQLMEKEINVDYAKSQGFDLVRRTIGGGAILDGPWEQDYFVIVNRKSPDCPATIPEFYQKYMGPPVRTLEKLGLEAKIRPPNDILVDGKKISGNGAISIERANVLAGDLLLVTPVDLMSQIINAPSEKFQDKLAESMEDWLTSITTQLGQETPREKVKQLYIESFNELLDTKLHSGKLTSKEQETLSNLVKERCKEEWIYSKDNDFRSLLDPEKRGVKVRGGVVVSESIYKARKMIRVILVSEEDRIAGISLSGDFFTHPYTGVIRKLEDQLTGVELKKDKLESAVSDAFKSLGLMTFGASEADFVTAILKARTERD
jgi:lipoate-protein ligase A